MTEFNYCYRYVTYDDDDEKCVAYVVYEDIFTGKQTAYTHFDADDSKQCDIDMKLYESHNNLIVESSLYSEDVKAILSDFRTKYEAMQISIYVHDVIDVNIPLSVYAISDVMDIIDIVSYNTSDDILIGIKYDSHSPKFEFYA